jgi:PAS domain S-box-containing protein
MNGAGPESERSRAEAVPRAPSRDELAIILRHMSDGVTAQARDGRLLFANDAAAALCGFSTAEEMLATPPAEIIARFDVRDEQGEPLPLTSLPNRHALQGRAAEAVLRFRIRRSGEERWSFVSSSPVLGASGEVELAVNVFRDVTQRKRTEEAWRFLAEAGATLASSLGYEDTLASVARLAVPKVADWCSVDVLAPDGDLAELAVAHANPMQVVSLKELRRRGAPAGVKAELLKVATSGEPRLVPDLMMVPLRFDNRPFGAIAFGNLSPSGHRYDRHDLLLAQEIARRAALAIDNARAYRAAREAVRARDTFLSIASHELKTPLSSISLLVSGLLRSARGDGIDLRSEQLVARLARIEEQTDHLTELITQLLDISHMQAGRFTLRRREVDLAEIARDVLRRFHDEAARLGTTLSLVAEEEGGSPSDRNGVMGVWDRSRIDQAISNLVGNALKYGGGTPVTVTVRGETGEARLIVRDGGPGIAEEDHQRIFDQYERAGGDPGPAEPASMEGLGLGLWIVRQLARAHGGDVTVASRRGAGAAFTISLPRTPSQHEAA